MSRLTVALSFIAFSAGCVDSLAPGELGVPRYFGLATGTPPLSLLPPTSDRDGNVYVLEVYDPAAPNVFVGHAAGGWSACACADASNCRLHEDGAGVHGFVGVAQERAWYWSGNALVEVNGGHGACRDLVDRDPVSGADIDFLAVVPWVWDAPSRRSLLAVVKSASDTVAWHVVVDLDRARYTNLRRFAPDDATALTVLGTGGDPHRREGVLLVRYVRSGTTRVEAIFLDEAGDETARRAVPVPNADALPAYAVQGFLAMRDGLAVGLLSTGDLLVVSADSAALPAVSGIVPVGVHAWQDQLFVVGTSGTEPVLAEMDAAGRVGSPETWLASRAADQALTGSLRVLDDRSSPRQWVDWSAVASAIGVFPFVHTHTMERYASDVTGWLVAGPSFDFGSGDQRTAVAFVPVGISYP